MEASKPRTKREAGNLALRFERIGDGGNVVMSCQNGLEVLKFVVGVVEPCKVETELGSLDAFLFCPAAGSSLSHHMDGGIRRKTFSEVKRDVNRALFEMLTGARDVIGVETTHD